jgi:hypothetical protein
MADAQTTTEQAEAAAKAKKDQSTAQRWIGELGVSEKAQSKWLTRAKKIIKRYKKEGVDAETGKRGFSLLWSNTETIRPALYARPPQPVVSRRFKDADPIGRSVSEVLERCLSFSIDRQALDDVLRDATFDFTLIARGQAWERYVPTFGDEIIPRVEVLQLTTDAGVEYRGKEDNEPYEADDIEGDEANGYTAPGEPYRPVIFEQSVTDYVNFEDFGCSPARTWNEVSYVWRAAYLSREELVERFGDDLGKKIPLDWGPKANGARVTDAEEMTKKAKVYEIWDKTSRRVFWISKAWAYAPLDEREDPLGLDDFFPCPKPLLGTTANDSLIPVPDYVFYQDQAEEIDDLTGRIGVLEQALRVKGFYAGDKKTDLNQLFKADDNMLIPVADWQSLKEGGGLQAKIEWMPINQVAEALTACINLRKQLIEDVYQITGVADILRGASDASETYGAQRIKAHWGAVRIRDRQRELARFARDILRIKGEVISEKFSIDTLRQMSGVKLPTDAEKQQIMLEIQQQAILAQGQAQQAAQMGQPPPPPFQPPPEVLDKLDDPSWEDVEKVLRDNATRQYRIDIETDSTIEPDETEDKQQAVEFITAMTGFFAQVGPMVQAVPQSGPMFAAMIKFAARRFRTGRELEDIIDTTLDQMTKKPPQGEEKTPEPAPDTTPIVVAQTEQQTEQIKQAGETERAMIAAQTKAQEMPLREADQRMKAFALQTDPQPQGTA